MFSSSPHISYESEHGSFNYRTAGVAIADERVLLLRIAPYSFYIMPGGRVEFYETSAECLQREMEEETKNPIAIEHPLWVVEDIYPFEGRDVHEICFYYAITLPKTLTELDQFQIEEESKEFEEKKELYFCWIPLKELNAIDLRPSYLKKKLQSLPQTVECFAVKSERNHH